MLRIYINLGFVWLGDIKDLISLCVFGLEKEKVERLKTLFMWLRKKMRG